jgi:NAD(P)-dependent dehydrogenase (short-subunit alcohol dehydrogenase family)
MRDALGAVQSVLVLGGTSEIAAATVRQLIQGRCRTVVLAGRDPVTCENTADTLRAAGATTVASVAFDALDTAGLRSSTTPSGSATSTRHRRLRRARRQVDDADPESAAGRAGQLRVRSAAASPL